MRLGDRATDAVDPESGEDVASRFVIHKARNELGAS